MVKIPFVEDGEERSAYLDGKDLPLTARSERALILP